VKVTGWSKSLEVTGGGQGIVSHAGLVLLRRLADATGLTAGLSRALASDRLLIHDRGRVFADLACAIADGAEVISDFRVISDQEQLFGLAASVPACWRALDEVASGGSRPLARITTAVNASRRKAWAAAAARHGALPGIRIADKVLEQVRCIRLDATVTPAHWDKELAGADFTGFGHHPLLAYCDNTAGPLAETLRRGGAGSNTTADHLEVLDAAITALPPAYRRRLMVTADGAGASHGLIERLDALARRPGYQLIYSVGWELGERERTAITAVPDDAWQIAVDHRGEIRERRADDACADRGCGHRKCWVEEAHVNELTALLRQGPAGDQLAGWPASMRVRRNPCRIEGGGQEESPERETVPLPVVFEIAGDIPVRYRVLVLLATFAGLRWGELIALRRHNIDLEACEIRIVETTAQLDTGRLRAETPKSRAGRRTVAFPAELVPEIRWHLERFAEPGERGLIFVGPKGARLRRSNFGRIWVKA
jgi:DDE family transposase